MTTVALERVNRWISLWPETHVARFLSRKPFLCWNTRSSELHHIEFTSFQLRKCMYTSISPENKSLHWIFELHQLKRPPCLSSLQCFLNAGTARINFSWFHMPKISSTFISVSSDKDKSSKILSISLARQEKRRTEWATASICKTTLNAFHKCPLAVLSCTMAINVITFEALICVSCPFKYIRSHRPPAGIKDGYDNLWTCKCYAIRAMELEWNMALHPKHTMPSSMLMNEGYKQE